MHQSGGAPRHRSGVPRSGAGPRHASGRGQGFGRFLGVTLLALVPGAGLVAAGRRVAGWTILGLTALALGATATYLLSGSLVGRAAALATLAVQQSWLVAGIVAIVVVALLWCLTVLWTAWAARPALPTSVQRVGAVALVAALIAAIAAPSGVGVRYALIQHDVLASSVFSSGTDTSALAGAPKAAAPKASAPDPWADTPRVNILLLGSDAGADRTGVRTDSMIVASIDTRTGDTVLLGVPRSLQNVPFSESDPLHEVWPNGFDCGDVCLMNAVWEQAATVHRDLFPGNPNPGLTATRDAISQVLGLPIDTYTIIDLKGFQSLVDAMGGVVINVPREIPIGGGHNQTTGAQLPIYGTISKGTQKLTGYEALWFARSRQGSDDYDRMGRDNIQTGIRSQDLPAWVTLVQRVQKGKITSLPLTNKVISTVNPDFDEIHALVQKAIDPPAATPKPTPTPGTTATPKPSATTGTAQESSAVC